MSEFIIVFRETLEATLIVGIIYMVLIKNSLNNVLKKVWLGVVSAIFASIGIAFLVLNLKNTFGNNSYQALFEGIFIYLTAIFSAVDWSAFSFDFCIIRKSKGTILGR